MQPGLSLEGSGVTGNFEDDFMPMITAEIFGGLVAELPEKFAKIIHLNAITYLHAEPDLLTIKIGFSPSTDSWYFNLMPLDQKRDPTFYVFAPIGRDVATMLEITHFIIETREQLRAQMSAAYPGCQFPTVPDRTKVVVVEMP